MPPSPGVPNPSTITSNPSPPSDPEHDDTTLQTLDSQINPQTSITYWSNTPATITGMLGGYPQVSRIDIQGSKSFVRKIQRQSSPSTTTTSPSSTTPPKMARILDCGAGIGRITTSLLTTLATTTDIVEPIAKFAQVLIDSPLKQKGQVGDVWIQGLESFEPPSDGRKYDVIWNQWCLGHLTDRQLVEWLRKAGRCLRGYGDGADDGEKKQEEDDGGEGKGWIMVKENLCTGAFGGDIFDEQDSSVTRSDESFKRFFEEAGLRIVRQELQTGFPKVLYPVKMYALRPK